MITDHIKYLDKIYDISNNKHISKSVSIIILKPINTFLK